MKKRFVSKKNRKKIRYKFLFFLVLFILGIIISFKLLLKTNIKIEDKELVEILLNNSNHHNNYNYDKVVNKIISFISPIDYTTPSSIIDSNYTNLVVKKESQDEKLKDPDKTPIIYIYNTHQTEEYAPSNFIEYSVKPTVQMNDYILQDVFSKNNLYSTVEETKIKEILNMNGWNYSSSYKASRFLMEEAKKKNNKLTYFIDVHRDSLPKDKTTVEINGKSYAKTIFIIGLENPKYQDNLAFTTKLNDKLNEKYPGLSKGIYKKSGPGVNGVYNQDFSPSTILIEMGGPGNTVDEVLNTSLAFADCFMEVINTNES